MPDGCYWITRVL